MLDKSLLSVPRFSDKVDNQSVYRLFGFIVPLLARTGFSKSTTKISNSIFLLGEAMEYHDLNPVVLKGVLAVVDKRITAPLGQS